MKINIDEDPFNADWIKFTRDPWPWEGVEAFRKYLHSVGVSVEDFKRDPPYEHYKDKKPWLKQL